PAYCHALSPPVRIAEKLDCCELPPVRAAWIARPLTGVDGGAQQGHADPSFGGAEVRDGGWKNWVAKGTTRPVEREFETGHFRDTSCSFARNYLKLFALPRGLEPLFSP